MKQKGVFSGSYFALPTIACRHLSLYFSVPVKSGLFCFQAHWAVPHPTWTYGRWPSACLATWSTITVGQVWRTVQLSGHGRPSVRLPPMPACTLCTATPHMHYELRPPNGWLSNSLPQPTHTDPCPGQLSLFTQHHPPLSPQGRMSWTGQSRDRRHLGWSCDRPDGGPDVWCGARNTWEISGWSRVATSPLDPWFDGQTRFSF